MCDTTGRQMNKQCTSASSLNTKIHVKMWKRSFFTLLVAIYRSDVAITAYNTEIEKRYVTKTRENPEGIEYDEKQVENNFWAIVQEIENQTGLREMVLAVLKSDEEKQAELEAKREKRKQEKVGSKQAPSKSTAPSPAAIQQGRLAP